MKPASIYCGDVPDDFGKRESCYSTYDHVSKFRLVRMMIMIAGPTLSIGATGIFNDNSDTYSSVATDEMNYQIFTASTGTTMELSQISV